MFFKRKKQNDKEKVIISFSRKLGIVAIRSLEGYIKKNKIIKCYIITESSPHQNVANYAGNIKLLEIIISNDFKREIEKIRNLHKNNPVKIIDLADFGETDAMRDPC
ncbi:MAG: hypothetical protein U9Q27_03730 [Patescibacteria group bacterium]|nr:hypothetical protein [Candidatus Caldatribacteriota bacterium]MEA3296216.1 hypothetical protein [Patescibacteria group bacterium]